MPRSSRSVAQQFAWNARYPGPGRQIRPAGHETRRRDNNVFGVDPADPAGKDDVQVFNEIHVRRQQASARFT
jgi:hypothetical protein